MTKEEIQAQIKVLKTELGKLEELANKPEEPKKFEFNFPKFDTWLLLPHQTIGGVCIKNQLNIAYGLCRTTKEGANLSFERNRRANLLEMLAEYLGCLKEFEYDEENWYVFYEYDNKSWGHDVTHTNYDPEKVYMSYDVAKEVVRLLNSGEYEL